MWAGNSSSTCSTLKTNKEIWKINSDWFTGNLWREASARETQPLFLGTSGCTLDQLQTGHKKMTTPPPHILRLSREVKLQEKKKKRSSLQAFVFSHASGLGRPPLWSRLDISEQWSVDCQEILNWCSWSPEDKPLCLCWSPDFCCGATIRSWFILRNVSSTWWTGVGVCTDIHSSQKIPLTLGALMAFTFVISSETSPRKVDARPWHLIWIIITFTWPFYFSSSTTIRPNVQFAQHLWLWVWYQLVNVSLL